jgi:hypothetical protein
MTSRASLVEPIGASRTGFTRERRSADLDEVGIAAAQSVLDSSVEVSTA